MANRYPSTPVTGGLNQLIDQLRKSFPSSLTADTLKKLGIGPNNESYLLAVLRFIGVLDDSGAKSPAGANVFNRHKDEEFEAGFAELVKNAYGELFELHGDSAWDLARDDLIHFFRSSDDSSELVGKRQTGAFEVLATKAGHRKEGRPTPRQRPERKASKPEKKAAKVEVPEGQPKKQKGGEKKQDGGGGQTRDVGLTVRVEVNLPVEGDQATYDRIFKSIRQYLIDG